MIDLIRSCKEAFRRDLKCPALLKWLELRYHYKAKARRETGSDADLKSSLYRITVLMLILSIASVTGLAASSIGTLATMPTTGSLDVSSANASISGNNPHQVVTVYFFYGNGCPHCAIAEPVIYNLSAKYPQVDFVWYEIYDNSTNQALFQQFNSRYGVQNPVVPEVYIGDKVLVGEDAIKSNLEPDIQHLLSTSNTENNTSNATGNASNASTSNASNTVNSSSNNSTIPADKGGNGYAVNNNPGQNDSVDIGFILVGAAAMLVVGFVVYRIKRKNG